MCDIRREAQEQVRVGTGIKRDSVGCSSLELAGRTKVEAAGLKRTVGDEDGKGKV